MFPKFLELIESYDTPAFYANEYSIDQKGRKIQRGTGGSPEGKGHNEEEEEEEGEGDDDDDEKGASTYKSRAPLLALLIPRNQEHQQGSHSGDWDYQRQRTKQRDPTVRWSKCNKTFLSPSSQCSEGDH